MKDKKYIGAGISVGIALGVTMPKKHENDRAVEEQVIVRFILKGLLKAVL